MGPYEVASAIGAGGMGEVYRARDTALDRDVALKILPDAFAGDAERLERFDREAKALAALNHPHIAQVYGFERSADVRAIVMEYVEGPTLADAIGSSGMPLADAWPVARQIADALEAAHERGIVHRDLKPSNVKLTAEGTVKVLDFGLAKAMDTSPVTSVSESPTLTARATQLGTIIGTASYMAPEQARGKPVDRRADVWAFGAVLYEMLTGTRAFGGDDVTAVLARVIEREADVQQLPPATPPAVRQLVARCLTKDRTRRLRDIGEARIVLDDVIAGREALPAEAPPVPGPRARLASTAAPWALAGVLGLLSLWLAFGSAPSGSGSAPVYAAINLPPDVEFFATPRISADGSVVAFVGVSEGIRQVYTRRLDAFDVVPLAGSEATSVATLSPDGANVAFVTNDGRLLRMSIDGSVSQQLAVPADYTSSLLWSADDRIIYSREGQLWSVPASGGDPVAATSLDAGRAESRHLWPALSEDGTLLFYQSIGGPEQDRIELWAADLRSDDAVQVTADDSQAIWASADRLVLARDDALFVAGHDHGRLTEAPVRVYDDVIYTVSSGFAASVADDGTLLAAHPDIARSRLVWVSDAGVETPVGGPVRDYSNPRVAPDGRRVAFGAADGLWTLDIARGTVARVTVAGRYPAWIDADRVVFRTLSGLMVSRADGTGDPIRLAGTTANDFPASVSPDGMTLAMVRITPDRSGDVYLLPLDGSGPARAFVSTPAYEGGAQFSPDGRWMVYTSDETGQPEVYLSPYPDAARRIPVSSDGGLHPLWSGDGRRIYYRSGQRVMAVDVAFDGDPVLSPPRALFDRQYRFGPNLSIPHYGLAPDGRSLLMVKEEPGARSLSLVTNWLPGR